MEQCRSALDKEEGTEEVPIVKVTDRDRRGLGPAMRRESRMLMQRPESLEIILPARASFRLAQKREAKPTRKPDRAAGSRLCRSRTRGRPSLYSGAAFT